MRLLLAGVLLEWEQERNSQVVFTFAVLGYFVLLRCRLNGEVHHKFVFGFFGIAVV